MDEIESYRYFYEKYFKKTDNASDEEVEAYIKEHAPDLHFFLTEASFPDEMTEIGDRLCDELAIILDVLCNDDSRQAFNCLNAKMDRPCPFGRIVASFVASRQILPPEGNTFYQDLSEDIDTIPIYREYLITLVPGYIPST